MMMVDEGDTMFVSVKSAECPLRLVLLDTGISVTLSSRDRDNFKSVFSAVVLGEVRFMSINSSNLRFLEGMRRIDHLY